LEVSSHALAQRRVDEVEFDVGVFTNLTHDHLDYHGSDEAYYQAKRQLFESLKLGRKQGVGVINLDDASGVRLAKESAGMRCLTYGLDRRADIQATELQLDESGSRFTVRTPDGTFDCRLPLVGRFNVYNALATVGVGIALGLPLSLMQEEFRRAPQVPGRLEPVERGQPFPVLVDYAHTEDALRNVLEMLREITAGRLLVAFGCGGERDPGKRAPMGRVAGQLADLVIVTSDNPRQESAMEITEAIQDGLRQAGRAAWRVELDRARAIEEVIEAAGPGDAVLVAGKGHESYQEFRDTVVPFDDRLHAAEALEALGWRERMTDQT
jgi:UDP-N-acetylmuramoyl-L-alanyl-D-glutamate--2,6-diaminopimelate ligase